MTAHPRREFCLRVLAACGTPLAVFAAPALADQKPGSAPIGDITVRAAAGYFGSGTDAVRVIGEAFLRQLGLEPTRAAILEHAGEALEVLGTVKGDKAVVSAFVSAVRRDFQEGRTLELEGWILSRVEVQLCALALLPVVN